LQNLQANRFASPSRGCLEEGPDRVGHPALLSDHLAHVVGMDPGLQDGGGLLARLAPHQAHFDVVGMVHQVNGDPSNQLHKPSLVHGYASFCFLLASNFCQTPARSSTWRALSDGWAPRESQSKARSSSTLISSASVLAMGLYVPTGSMNRPSRAAREPATTSRSKGWCLAPMRLRRIRTATSNHLLNLPPTPEEAAPTLAALPAPDPASRLPHLPDEGPGLLELFQQAIHILHLGAAPGGNPPPAGAVDDLRVPPFLGRH